MKTVKRRALSLARLQRIRDSIISSIAQVSDRWTFDKGNGSRFADTVYEAGNVCWLTATLRETPDESSKSLVLRITLNVTQAQTYHRADELRAGAYVEGETEFKVIDVNQPDGWGGWRGWVRHGIDCASVWLGAHRPESNSYSDVADLLRGERARVERALQAAATARQVPGYPFSRQPAWFAEAAEKLRAGGSVTLTPSGFGVGYRFTTHRYSRFDSRAPQAFEQALGVSPIYAQSLDCD
jgi:hypothetical protein